MLMAKALSLLTRPLTQSKYAEHVSQGYINMQHKGYTTSARKLLFKLI